MGQPSGTNLDLVNSLVQGYKAGQVPFAMKRQAEQEQLANAMNQLKLQQEPERFQAEQALREAQSGAIQNKANLPFGGEIAPGAVGQAMWLSMIGKRYGPNSPEYITAKKSYEAELSKSEGLNQYRDMLAQTMGKRFSTTLGKEQQELSDIDAGFMPGTNRAQAITPEQQQEKRNQYQLKIQKGISDVQTRNRSLFASNIDKTIEGIDPKDLTQYSGVQGGIKLKADQLQSALGKSSPEFGKYNKALTLSNLLAKQVRQFYGDSITPQIQEKLGALTNPTSWQNDPKVALQNFNTFKDILQKETQTYRGALKGTGEYKGVPESKSSGTTKIYYNGKPHLIPNDKVKDAIAAGGSLNG